MSRISDRIKKYISCPQFGNEHYGQWGILTLEQRKLIKELAETCDIFEEACDNMAKQLKETTERLFEFEQILKENNFEDTGDLKIFVTLAFKFGKQRKKEIKEHQKLKQQLAEKDIEIERLKQNYDEVWEDTYFSVREDFELNNNCNECRRCYAEEFSKQLAEKDQAIESLQEINQSLGQTCNNDAKEIERLREQLEEKEKFLERIMSGEYIPANIVEKSLKLSNQTAIAVLEEILDNEVYINSKLDFESGRYVSSKIIETKIKSLKGEK